MKLYLDTSSPVTIIKIDNTEYLWESGRDLAENLLEYLKNLLLEHEIKDESGPRPATFSDLTEITFMSGPGSFTGLRIGASVVNTLASQLNIPLYDHKGNRHKIILPDYGRPANITPPKK